MRVGDLVTVSEKGKRLSWMRLCVLVNEKYPLYGVIVGKTKYSKNISSFKVSWFYENGLNHCNNYIFFNRELLKMLK